MWTRLERHWRDQVLCAFAPFLPSRPLLPEPLWEAWFKSATPLFRVGLRAAIWAVQVSSLVRYLHPIGKLDPDRTEALVQFWDRSRLYPAKQVVFALKTTTALIADARDSERAR